MAEPIDEFTLLCESCGYVLTGLPTTGRCPECGQSIAASLPDHRQGSPWQLKPGVSAWLRTFAATVRRPSRQFSDTKMESRRAFLLAALNISFAMAMIAAAVVPFATVLESVQVVLGGWVAFATLTAIEAAGVMFFGRRRRWRITPTVALVVCAHASVGWIVAAALGIAGAWTMGGAPASTKGLGLAVWVLDQLLPVFGFLLGLLFFETLVYIGIRRCRFANRIPPAPHA